MPTAAVSVAVGKDFACALLQTGAVKCWGANALGQLGANFLPMPGDDIFERSPLYVHDLDDAATITAGAQHACALRSNATAVCWPGSTARTVTPSRRTNASTLR